MSEQMRKSKLLEQIQAERERLERTLAELSTDQMTQPGIQDQWSVKDILAHITVWEKRMTRWLGETLRGEVPQMLPPGMTWDDLDQMNEQTYLENRDRLLAEVLSEFHHSYPQALGAVEAASEEDLIDPHRFEWRGGKPLWEMVAANTFWHYEEHGESLRTWLEKRDEK
jgi:hypothetical protein